MRWDAIVIGAGLSGLVCARRLTAAGRAVVVVEARERLGGRLCSARLGGATVDLGGVWWSAGQPRLAELADELGVARVPQLRDGRAFVAEPPAGLWRRARAALAQGRAMRRILRAAAVPERIPADASLARWLGSAVADPVARERIALHAALVFAQEPSELSARYYAAALGATGGFGAGGGAEQRFAGGAAELVARLAAGLDVRLDQPVVAIAQPGAGGGPVTVRTARGAVLEAAHAVLAVPPALARRIDVALAPPARAFAEAARPGPVVKCFAAYDRAFWRDGGWSGEGYRPRGDVRATVALAPDPILVAFVVGAAAAGWRARDPAARRGAVLAVLAEQFGPEAAVPVDYLEHDWGADPWAAGCVAGLPPGAGASAAAWRAPLGRLHLAGTESAARWPGYMEGAIEAGERAAAEVRAAG